ncbi:hypothetical protein HYPSUDRAFT_91355 [Hypholoma sublateritium FD-334 SS-4]|uniref:Uncharacterized protein n=1 Tax=Hypholoma sublateritium (strain FD-334 SS-4) TaxID=945553 RepID=A0A0D2NAY9_HYPSF|nr:hypothetical protein HYPSUDRAFT_91355 [Hypholoma sublateritium FD-334 SS-4]
MPRWSMKLIAAAFRINGRTRTSSGIQPEHPSHRAAFQVTADTTAVANPIHSTSPPPTGPESTPADIVNHLHTQPKIFAGRHVFLRWRTKVVSAAVRERSPSRKPHPRASIIPVHPQDRHIASAVLVSGLVAAAPLHEVSPLATAIESGPDDDADLSQAKSVLHVLAALGDGVAGVPWLKGAAGLGLEIVNTLERVQSNKCDCRDLALRICEYLILMHRNARSDYEKDAEPQHIIDFRRDLYRILRTVKTISSYKYFRRLLMADDIKQQLTRCERMISHSRDIFLVGAHVDLAARAKKQAETSDIECKSRSDFGSEMYTKYNLYDQDGFFFLVFQPLRWDVLPTSSRSVGDRSNCFH